MARAIEVLDDEAAEPLTLRSLASSLSTGPGALYHHITNREHLLECAAAVLIDAALAGHGGADGEDHDIARLMLRVFDTIDTHPWLGSQLTIAPWQPAVLALFDALGTRLKASGASEEAQFYGASALVHYTLGLASQYGAVRKTRLRSDAGGTPGDRPDFLASTVRRALEASAVDRPFLRRMEAGVTGHDDRAQFSYGVELIVSSILGRAAFDSS